MKTKTMLIGLLVIIFIACSKDDNFERGAIKIIDDDVSNSIFSEIYNPPLVIDARDTDVNILIDSIDVDGDGIDDIRFTSQYYGFGENGYSKNSDVEILNDNLQFQKRITNDTVYRCIYITEDTYYHLEYRNTNFNCSFGENINFIDISDYLEPLKKGDTIVLYDIAKFVPINLNFSYNEYFPLCRKDSSRSSHEDANGMIDYYFRYKYLDLWDNIGERYLFFRIVNGSQLKYGWIKLEINDVSTIKIHEVTCFSR